MAIDPDDVARLRAIEDALEPDRRRDGINCAKWIRAHELRRFGDDMLEEPEGAFDRRAEQEAADLQRDRDYYGAAFDRDPEYAQIGAIGDRLIAEGRTLLPPPDGYLGYKIIRDEVFGFLKTEFGMESLPDPNDVLLTIFQSATIRFELGFPRNEHSCNQIAHTSDPERQCVLEDVLWRAGNREHFLDWPAIPTTPEEVRSWFETVAAILKEHARDVLADAPGAFQSLVAAAEERDHLLGIECERLYTEFHGHPPPPLP